MVRSPRRLAVRATRQAISPRLAMSTERNMAGDFNGSAGARQRHIAGRRAYRGDAKLAAGALVVAAACAGGAGGAGVQTGSACPSGESVCDGALGAAAGGGGAAACLRGGFFAGE